jgi:phage regulator Rha-like protein
MALQSIIPVEHCPEDFVTPVDKIVYGTLGDPITPEYVKDVNNLEKKRRKVLKEAKRVKKMGKKLDDDIAQAQDALKRARNMEEKYVTLIQQQVEEGGDP